MSKNKREIVQVGVPSYFKNAREIVILVNLSRGSHYHKDGCVMVDAGYTKIIKMTDGVVPINIAGKTYYPCPACFGKRRKTLATTLA